MFDDAEVIHTYSRAEALRDGAIVAADAALVHQAGWRYPVAYTAAVHAECIALTAAARRACNDVTGRAWDVLWMGAMAARKRAHRDGDRVAFTVHVVRARVRPTPTQLVAHVGPGDDGRPVVTIMFPEED